MKSDRGASFAGLVALATKITGASNRRKTVSANTRRGVAESDEEAFTGA
jgi:hypothetical protein